MMMMMFAEREAHRDHQREEREEKCLLEREERTRGKTTLGNGTKRGKKMIGRCAKSFGTGKKG